MKKVVLSYYLLLFSFGHTIGQKKAVFIILDGIPADVVESVDTPTLDEIAKNGGYSRAYTGGIAGGYSETPTISAVGYNSLLTGTWANKHNVWGNGIKDPTYNYWNIFRVAKSANPALKTAIFSTWLDNRTKLVGEGLEKAGNVKIDFAFDGFELDTIRFPHTEDRRYIFNIDELVSKEAGKYILEKGPDLSWVYLEFTDDMGHRYGDGPEMYDAVEKADIQVKRIWESIKIREKEFGEDWMILITTDHGRDKTTGKGHGGQSERERTIWMVTNSTKLNKSYYQKPAMVDIMPSLLTHMEIQIPVEIKKEIDGTSFVGQISVKDVNATMHGNRLKLNWTNYADQGSARIFMSNSNNFKEGGDDSYQEIGKCHLLPATCELDLPPTEIGFLKILMQVDEEFWNTWLINK
ncbi:MAG: alkaline phosphatase family protein [Saprospiraceae bacterium]|nr:alkaline phosphatase family protein [Saprospiraceae bacterium]